MRLTDYGAQERPRERLLQHGPGHLSDAEILAMVLGTGTKARNAIELARHLLDQHRGLKGLWRAEAQALMRTPGIGLAKYAQIAASFELAKRALQEALPAGTAIAGAEDCAAYLKARLLAYDREVFVGVFLDNRHRIIATEELARGSIDSVQIYPREIVKRVLAHNAAALIFAHNHPSGANAPSQADLDFTRQMIAVLSAMDVRVLDHFIVGEGEPVSLRALGCIEYA